MRRGVCDGVACAAFIVLAQHDDLPLVCGRAVLGHSLGGVVRGRTSPPRLSGTKQELGAMGWPHGLGASFLLLVSRPASDWARWNGISSRFSNEVRGDPGGPRNAARTSEGWSRAGEKRHRHVERRGPSGVCCSCHGPLFFLRRGPEAASGGGAWWELGVASS
jgi:hypothetical protein